MGFLGNLAVGVRLSLAFAVVLATSLVITLVGINGIDKVHDRSEAIYEANTLPLAHTGELVALTLRARVLAMDMMLNPSAENVERRDKETSRNFEAGTKLLDGLLASGHEAEEHQLFETVKKARAGYFEGLAAVRDAVRAGKSDAARQAYEQKVRPVSDELLASFEKLSALQLGEAKQGLDDIRAVERSMTWTSVTVAAVALALGAWLAYAMTRSIRGPVREAMSVAERIRDGDLTAEIRAQHRDEFGRLLDTLREMQASLRTIVGNVRAAVDSVTTASGEIAAGNQDLSSRTEEQASSLQETAASMEELTSTVRQSAEHARTADGLANAARDAAAHGGEVVGQVVATMEDISASSRKIADIIAVIDGIAFQTNILALNAAVEAARAGDQGRGFAVVAGEVRTLAQRSAQAAREIKALIGDSLGKVEAGSRQVSDAGVAMNEIVSQVGRVTDLIGEITNASQEQSSGIGQVNDAVSQMDQVTQQNAALVEQSAAAAASMKSQARQLSEAVSVFRLP